MPIKIQRLSDRLSYGAMVTGLVHEDLADEGVRRDLVELFVEKGLVLFRGCPGSVETHVTLSRCFGEPEVHPSKGVNYEDGHPEIIQIIYSKEDGTLYKVDGELRGGWLPWHSDLVFVPRINRGGIIRARKLPAKGGQTGFIDQITAYETLDEGLKREIEGLDVVYQMDMDYQNQKFGRRPEVEQIRLSSSMARIRDNQGDHPRVLHPLVYAQRETGRKVLNLCPLFALGIHGMENREGDELLETLAQHVMDERNAYYHDWREDDMVLWDNWRMLHTAVGVAPDDYRWVQRTSIAGDYAYGRLESESQAAAARKLEKQKVEI